MRLITGDELGLLKETIPELCRPPPTDASGLPLHNLPTWMMGSSAVNKRARPSATSIQAAASAYGQGSSIDGSGAVNRLENEGIMTRDRGVVSLSFVPGSSGSDAFQFAALRMNGTVEKWAASRDEPYNGEKNSEANITPARYRIVSSYNDVFGTKERAEEVIDEESDNGNKRKGWHANPPVKPIGLLSTTSNDKTVLTAADSSGAISILSDSCQLITKYHAYESNDVVLSYTKGGFANNHVASCIAVKGDVLAVGGRERGVRVLDLESGKCVWKAKNMPPDPQTLLQQPMWTTALQFIHTPHNHSNGSHNNSNEPNSSQNLLASGTAYKQVQIYDVRSSSSDSKGTRRPILHTPQDLLQHRVTSLLQLPNSNQLIVADAIGDCHILDLRKFHTGKQLSYKKQKSCSASQEIGLGRLVGPGGSIRQLAMHPTLPMVACVGLDRKLWSWDIKTKRMVDCVYLRQRLNCLLICEDEGWNGSSDDAQVSEERIDGEGVDWEAEGDEVHDYVDSEDEDGDVVDDGTGSSSEGTESESDDNDDDTSSEEEGSAPSKTILNRANKKQKR